MKPSIRLQRSWSDEPANQNPTSHHSTIASPGGSVLSVSGDNDTVSSMSASSSLTIQDSNCSVPSFNSTTPLRISDETRLRNSNAQPAPRTPQLNHESEQPLMVDDHEASTGGNIPKRSLKHKIKKVASGWWLWEIGGVVLSIGCMLAILIIIPRIHNQPLKDWHFIVAPNTMISTLITVSKTSMLLAVASSMSQLKWQHFHSNTHPISELDLYDEASRGPWGALLFILTSPFRWRNTVAILGAFVMLSSLTMEPLAQQLFSFQNQYVSYGNRSAWISTATSYGQDYMTFRDVLDARAHSLILQGLLGSPPSISHTCSSGNCSWSDFHALGICSSCENVTSKCAVKENTSHFAINYTTPKGIDLGLEYSNSQFTRWAVVMSGNITREDIINHIDIASVAIANASRLSTKTTDSIRYSYREPDITECKITWCARFYSNLKMTNGNLNPYKVEKSELTIIDDSIDRNCEWGDSQNVTLRATRGGLTYQFVLGCWELGIVSHYFENFFTFQVNSDAISLASGELIINTASVPEAMDTITDAFSIYVMTSTPNTTRHYGEAFYPEIFTIVRWQWLIFPGILTILGASFLGTSLWISRTHRTSFLWKDSLVPLLFHGLSGWEKADLRTKDKIEMDERAERMMAKLEMDDSGSLKFVKA